MRSIDISTQLEHLHEVLAHIQNVNAQATAEGISSKHQHIRIVHWVRKLRSQPTSNSTWLKSVLEYANALLHMLLEGAIEEPFTKMPPQGPLAALSRYQVAQLTKAAQLPKPTHRPKSSPPISRVRSSQLQPPSNNSEEDVRPPLTVEKATKQVQTQEQDDQWEWQRVWKGAFDKLRQQLQGKTVEADALAAENKELRAVLVGQQKALEEAQRDSRDVENKHQAELENLRAVHALELRDLQDRHRQKLRESTLQNDEKLLRRRRESRFLLAADAPPSSSDANADFLQYIDAFYSATLQLTSQNQA